MDAFAEFGYIVPFERIRSLIGMGGDKLLPTVVPGLSSTEGVGKRIAARSTEIFLARYSQGLQPTPGARALVERMRAEGLRLVVASSAKQNELETLLKAARVADLLHEATTASETDASKPAPDVVEVALKKIAQPPRECVLIGDTPYDVESAARAGVATIAVRCGGHPDAELKGAIAIYDDPADLLAQYDTSPLAAHPAARPAMT